MNLSNVVANGKLTGLPFSSIDRDSLLKSFGDLIPLWFLDLCTECNLAGSILSLEEEDDLSGVGVELKWMTAEQMIDEASNVYPGVVAIKYGYVPFGICLEGSGDPYFLKIGKNCDFTPVVRVPHSSVVGDELNEDAVEIVASNLVDFFEKSMPN